MNTAIKKAGLKRPRAVATKKSSGSGLEDKNHFSISPTAPIPATNGGGPLMIDIDLIDEDPDQPRTKDNPGFAAESIAELAASFGPNGPKSPISLRINPDKQVATSLTTARGAPEPAA